MSSVFFHAVSGCLFLSAASASAMKSACRIFSVREVWCQLDWAFSCVRFNVAVQAEESAASRNQDAALCILSVRVSLSLSPSLSVRVCVLYSIALEKQQGQREQFHEKLHSDFQDTTAEGFPPSVDRGPRVCPEVQEW